MCWMSWMLHCPLWASITALVPLRTSAEVFYASCVCLRFNGSVVIISVSFQWFIQWKAGVIHQDFLLHSVPCLKEWTFVSWTWMFFKAFLVCVSLAGVVTTVSFSLTFELKLNFDLQSKTSSVGSADCTTTVPCTRWNYLF